MNWLFLATIAFLVVSAVWGYYRGFVKIAYSLASSIIALVLVAILSPHVQTLLIEKTPIYDKTVEICTTRIQEKMNETIEEAGNNISDVMKEAGLPDGVLKLIDKIEIKESGELTAIQQAGEKVAQWIVLIISFVVTYIVVIIALKVLGNVLNLATKLPIIKGANKWLGLVLGSIQGVINVWLAGLILSSVCTTEVGMYLVSLVYENSFLKFMYEQNGIVYIVSLFFG